MNDPLSSCRRTAGGTHRIGLLRAEVVHALGVAPPDYGTGRVCPACGSRLRRTNPGPFCDPCMMVGRAPEPFPVKTCRSCGRVRPLERFGKDASRHDGRQSVCMECRKQRDAKRREDPEAKARYLERKRRWQRERRAADRATVVFPNHTQEMELS